MSRILITAILVLAALLLGVILSGKEFGEISENKASLQSIALMSGYLLLVSGSLIAGIRSQGWAILRYAVIWLAIGCFIALVYRIMH